MTRIREYMEKTGGSTAIATGPTGWSWADLKGHSRRARLWLKDLFRDIQSESCCLFHTVGGTNLHKRRRMRCSTRKQWPVAAVGGEALAREEAAAAAGQADGGEMEGLAHALAR